MKRKDFPPDASSAARGGGKKRVKFTQNAQAESEAAEVDFDLDYMQAGPNPSTQKKRAVKTEGYESDSSDEEDEGPKENGEKAMVDEDDDMFSSAPKAKNVEPGKGKKVVDKGLGTKSGAKNKDYLELGDIEGQEFSQREYEDDEDGLPIDEEEEEDPEYVEEDDHANDDDAPRTKKSKKGMGFQLSSFNMSEEMREGRFSADGSYVPNSRDPSDQHDKWLEDVDKRAIRAAREAKRKHEERLKAEEGKRESGEADRDECYKGLADILRTDGETVMQALSRLGAKQKEWTEKNVGGNKMKTKKKPAKKVPGSNEDDMASGEASMDVDGSEQMGQSAVQEEIAKRDPFAAEIDRLTSLCSTLLTTYGETEVYDQTYDNVLQTLRDEGAIRRDWVPPSKATPQQDTMAATEPPAEASSSQSRRGVIARPSALSPASGESGDMFYYRFMTAPENVQGPYPLAAMQGWAAGGYFQAGCVVRKNGDTEWKSWEEASR